MTDAALLFHHYGELGIALIVFAKRMGIPVPALPFLLLAGAQGVRDPVFALNAAGGALAAAVVADGLWFVAGRRFGAGMLALVCKISLSPDTCIRKSELAFARRGSATVLLAKFIPGVAGLAPPLAGALGMSRARFTALNLAGTLLWVGGGVLAGVLLHRQVARIVATVADLGSLALPLFLLLAGAYLLWLSARRALMTLAALRMPRLSPLELAEKLARGERVLPVDVRGPGLVQQRIPGAIHAFFDRESDGKAPVIAQGVELVVYCDCPNDVTAARVATMLRKRGLPARVLTGGFPAWKAAGLPLEPAQPAAGLAAPHPHAATQPGPAATCA